MLPAILSRDLFINVDRHDLSKLDEDFPRIWYMSIKFSQRL